MQQYSFISADDLISAAKAEAIGSTSSSLTAMQDTQMLGVVNRLNHQFVNAAQNSPIGGWSWMLRPHSFQTKSNTTLNGAVSAGAATVLLTSSADFDSSGRVVIERSSGVLDFIDYESNALDTLTISTATNALPVSLNHVTGELVEKLYPLPARFSKAKKLYVNSSEYNYMQVDRFPYAGYYTTLGNYILMPKGIGEQDAFLWYYQKAETIDSLDDLTSIPVDYSRWAIETLKAHIFTIRRKRADIDPARNQAQLELERALAMDAEIQSNSEATRLQLPY